MAYNFIYRITYKSYKLRIWNIIFGYPYLFEANQIKILNTCNNGYYSIHTHPSGGASSMGGESFDPGVFQVKTFFLLIVKKQNWKNIAKNMLLTLMIYFN